MMWNHNYMYITSSQELRHSFLCMFHCIERSLCNSKSVQLSLIDKPCPIINHLLCSRADNYFCTIVAFLMVYTLQILGNILVIMWCLQSGNWIVLRM